MAKEEKSAPETITVYKLNEGSADILKSDLKLWEKAGYTQNPPETALNVAEKAILLKRANNLR